MAERLEAGTVMINETLMTHAFPGTPWGGIKERGVGRVHPDEGTRGLAEARHVTHELFSLPNPAWYPCTTGKAARFMAAAEHVHRNNGLAGNLRSLWNLVTGDDDHL